MILLMRNDVGEFVPGCDHTFVRLDDVLIGLIAQRARQGIRALEDDPSLAEARYWDASPVCIAAMDAEPRDLIEEALENGDGWAILEESVLGSFKAASCDCTRMSVCPAGGVSVGWDYRVGSEPVRTADVPLAELAAKLGSPLGDPIRAIP